VYLSIFQIYSRFTSNTMSSISMLALALAAMSYASPLSRRQSDEAAAIVTVTFVGGPASYELSFPGDGTFFPTGKPRKRLVQEHAHRQQSQTTT
jgi:hypothetical protein